MNYTEALKNHPDHARRLADLTDEAAEDGMHVEVSCNGLALVDSSTGRTLGHYTKDSEYLSDEEALQDSLDALEERLGEPASFPARGW